MYIPTGVVTSKVPDHRTDYVFLQSGGSTKLDTIRCRLFGDQPIDGMWLSDHFGVLADINVSSKSFS